MESGSGVSVYLARVESNEARLANDCLRFHFHGLGLHDVLCDVVQELLRFTGFQR